VSESVIVSTCAGVGAVDLIVEVISFLEVVVDGKQLGGVE
jgi:hypothetical protein